ncbi:ichthyin [Dactylonectria estremocensis]|uniref:Ichthyin n=1 Tax=Dactylonectria estremocensis TaxID=1079267 RepID=A0A9P9DJH1_9HYPO|nr:ichthyin [Dactylonectria estremocensis]
MLLEERYIGLALAIGSSVCIGISFIVTKKGLMHTEGRRAYTEHHLSYLKSPVWWVGTIILAIGEIGNFTAYAFAPAILVTPLGAISVIVGAILGSYFLQETLGVLGRLGSTTCLMGALIIVLHVQPNEEIETIDQFLNYAIQPSFLLYTGCVIGFSVVMIYKIAPTHGRKTPLIYLSICSAVGSVSVMSTKAFGIALKLTFSGENQFAYPSTYIFMISMVACILTQMNYFNRALSIFPLSIVNPLYYVFFTSATLCASIALFGGINTSGMADTLSVFCGVLLNFAGVYLLNMSRFGPDMHQMLPTTEDATSADIVSNIQTSMTRHERSIHNSWNSSMTNDRDTMSLNAAFEAEIDSRI